MKPGLSMISMARYERDKWHNKGKNTFTEKVTHSRKHAASSKYGISSYQIGIFLKWSA